MTDKKQFQCYVIYNKPNDYPDHYVARCQYVDLDTKEITFDPLTLISKDPDVLRRELESFGLVKLDRQPNDDPVIMETWI